MALYEFSQFDTIRLPNLHNISKSCGTIFFAENEIRTKNVNEGSKILFLLSSSINKFYGING